MVRYFFHLHECGRLTEDREGIECASREEAMDVALSSARDVMVGELRAGKLCLACYITITEGSNGEIGRVRFRDAVSVSGLAAA